MGNSSITANETPMPQKDIKEHGTPLLPPKSGMGETPGKKSGLISLFLNITIWLSLTSALLYTAGWSFAYHYFAKFHVGLLTLALPKEYYFIYSFWVVKDHALKLLLFLLFILILWYGLFILIRYSMPFRGHVTKAHPLLDTLFILTPVILMALFWASYKLGSITAASKFTEQQSSDYSAYPRTKVYMRPQEGQYSLEMQELLEKGCFRLLLQNANNLFLFYP